MQLWSRMSQSHFVPVPFCPSPVVYQSHCEPVPMCTRPIVSLSRCVPVLLCTRPLCTMSRCVPVPPVPLCPSPIAPQSRCVRFSRNATGTQKAELRLWVWSILLRTMSLVSCSKQEMQRRFLRHFVPQTGDQVLVFYSRLHSPTNQF